MAAHGVHPSRHCSVARAPVFCPATAHVPHSAVLDARWLLHAQSIHSDKVDSTLRNRHPRDALQSDSSFPLLLIPLLLLLALVMLLSILATKLVWQLPSIHFGLDHPTPVMIMMFKLPYLASSAPACFYSSQCSANWWQEGCYALPASSCAQRLPSCAQGVLGILAAHPSPPQFALRRAHFQLRFPYTAVAYR